MLPILDLIKSTVPEGSVFLRPMSKKARKLLTDMLSWTTDWHIKLGGFKTAMKLLAENFDVIAYEEACHKFDTTKYIQLIPASKKCKSKEELLQWFTLSNLKSDAWVGESNISYNPNKVGLISEPGPSGLYTWLTTNFLLVDFNEQDLNKIAQLGQPQFDLDTIKTEAKNIADPDKRNISYLYAIVLNKALTAKANKEKMETKNSEYRSKINSVIDLELESRSKSEFRAGTARAARERARAYIEILKTNK